MAHVKGSMPLFEAAAAVCDVDVVLSGLRGDMAEFLKNPTVERATAMAKAATKDIGIVQGGLKVSDTRCARTVAAGRRGYLVTAFVQH